MSDLDIPLSLEQTDLEPVLDNPPKLLCLNIAGIFNFYVSSLLHDLLRCERSSGVSPPRVRPPLLDCVHFLQIRLLFFVNVTHVYRYSVCEDHKRVRPELGSSAVEKVVGK